MVSCLLEASFADSRRSEALRGKGRCPYRESIEIELREDGTLVESLDGKQAEAGTWAITAVDQVGLYWDDEEPAWNYAIHCDSNGKADKLDWGFEGSGDYARID